MTGNSSKRTWLTVGVAALLVAGNLLAFLELQSGHSAARAAALNLRECKELADEIVGLRRQPSKVSIEGQSATQLSKRMEEALRAAQMPSTCLVRVDPQPARRLKDSEFKEQPTGLELRSVTLRQLVQFLQKLESGEARLRISSLGLVATQKPLIGAAEETWTAQVVLTSLIFAPKKIPPK